MKKLFYLLLIFILTACSQNIVEENSYVDSGTLLNLSEEEFLSISFENPKEIETSEVKSIAVDFLNTIQEKSSFSNTYTRKANSDYELTINGKSYYNNQNSAVTRSGTKLSLPVYEVDVTSANGKGVVYVTADERYAQVISYVPVTGDDKELKTKSGESFLHEWAKATAYEHFLEIEDIRAKLKAPTMEKVAKALNIPISEVKIENILDKITIAGVRAIPISKPTTQIIDYVLPLVPVQWDQHSPYNLSLPKPTPPATQKNVYAGCAVTAACQLMCAIKPDLTIEGTKINWDYLTQYATISESDPQDKLDMLGKLHKWVYEELDATPSYNSSGQHTGTSVYASSQIAFYSRYFNTGTYSAYNPDNLKQSFDEGHPSLIRGQGHAWLLDGYMIAKQGGYERSSTRALVRIYDVFWHANLGWGGQGDGYYKLKLDTHVDFETGYYIYNTTELSIYPGLYKKNVTYNF